MRIENTTPGIDDQITDAADRAASNARADALLAAINEALSNCTHRMVFVWRAVKGLDAHGQHHPPMKISEIARTLNMSRNYVRGLYMEASSIVWEYVATQALESGLRSEQPTAAHSRHSDEWLLQDDGQTARDRGRAGKMFECETGMPATNDAEAWAAYHLRRASQ